VGTHISGPLLLFLQQAGVGGLTGRTGRARSRSRSSSRRSSSRTSGSRHPYADRGSTACVGRPRSSRISDHSRRARCSTPPFIGKPGFPSDGTIPSDKAMWQPRLGISWDPRGDGRQVLRISAGLFYSRIPVSRSRAAVRPTAAAVSRCTGTARSNGFGLTPPAWLTLIPRQRPASRITRRCTCSTRTSRIRAPDR
jgi:hypothetical protein